MVFNFVDLFSGIGGFRLALEELGSKCLGFSEIDKYAIQTYKANFDTKNEIELGDITKLSKLPFNDIDLIVGGVPCQAWSVAGKGLGFDDPRGKLWFDTIRIIKENQPKAFIFENVKGLVSKKNKTCLDLIVNELKLCGYYVTYKLLNTKDFGLPQNRERIFIVGTKYQFDFTLVSKSQEKPIIRDILEKKGFFEYLKPESYTILDKALWKQQESNLIFCGYRNKKIRLIGTRKNTEHLSRVHKQPNRIYYSEAIHPSICTQESAGRYWIYDNNNVRKLTLRECARLQGFPDSFIIPVSDNQAYKQFGNAVSVPVVKAIAENLILKV